MLTRLLLRSLRRPSHLQITTTAATFNLKPLPLSSPTTNPTFLIPFRSFAFSSAEEAAAERRRRKRRLRIEPPLHALQRDPNAPRLDATLTSRTPLQPSSDLASASTTASNP
ncbi:hypothetical protein L1987_78087 [Smallanthus sonchifolius]|uniref:Uncharacterized protein n=1 Tax=Smallanthus sonchifolius TaxID=185202 RepID=A0ACB8ZAV8_9ASTR|nr:hypothetical protein L1987_78087 [Smallanthus sonchifolius]